MNNQEVFNKVATHLFTQGKPAMATLPSGVVSCAYRSSEGLSCAVGCLIPDELYSSDLEGKTVPLFAINTRLGEALGLDNSRRRGLLSRLQEVHDGIDPQNPDKAAFRTTEKMRARLYEVAGDFELDPAILETLSFEGR